MIKSHTDLEQSKKLAEILPLESADLYYDIDFDKDYRIKMPTNGYFGNKRFFTQFPEVVPCWSLAALLDILPYPYIEQNFRGKWTCKIEQENTTYLWEAPNPVDACYEMILKLHGLKILGYEENNQVI